MALFDGIAREYTYLSSVGRTFYRLRTVTPDSPRTINDIVEDFAREKPKNIAVLYQDRVLTYSDLAEGANRYAHWAMAQGIKKGDVVALFMEGRPEYLQAWLGIQKLGGIVALINTNLRGAPLAHCIAIANARHVIVGAELCEQYSEIASSLDPRPIAWATGARVSGTEDLDAALAEASSATPDRAVR